MNNIRPIIQSIRSLLDSGIPNSFAERTAEDYARLCTEAEQRLTMAAAMLENGSDYQALQVAEQDPPLLDLVGALSFGDEKAWQTFCEAHHLRIAPRLNARTVQALDALYVKGITASHPLYKDFRAAVLSREDDKSLQILRTILKLNPSDENARNELQRLDHKRLQQTLTSLREALKAHDEEKIASLVETLAAVAPEEKLQRSNAYVAGAEIRRRLRRHQAEAQLPEMVTQMIAQQAEQDWRSVGHGLESLQSITDEYEIEIPADIRPRVEELRAYHERENLADQRRRDFQNALQRLVAQVDEVDTRLTAGARPGYAEIAGWDESITRQWKELQVYQIPVPNETQSRLQAGRQALRSRLNHMRRLRFARSMAKAAVITGLLASSAATGLHGWKAWSVSQELSAYQQQQLCTPAEALIHRLRSDDGWLVRWPYLHTALDEADAWTHQVRLVEHRTQSAVETLESSFEGDSSRLSPSQLVTQLEEADALAASLPPELAERPKQHLIALRQRMDLQLARLAKELAISTDESLTAIERESGKWSFEMPSSQVAEAVKRIAHELAPLEAALQPETEALRLPEALENRIAVLQQRLQNFESELKKFADVRAQTAAADSLESYQAALAGWKEIPFIEAASASVAIEAVPSVKAFQSRLLTDGDESALKAVIEDSSGPDMIAATPTPEDLKILLALRDDEFLNDVWENRVVDYSHGGVESTLWSGGTLTRAQIGENFRWTGRYYDPAQSPSSVSFIKRDLVRVQAGAGYLGTGVTASRLSPTSAFIRSLQLNRMTDEDGRRFMYSLLAVFDQTVQNKDGSPVARAYLMGRLENMLMHQKHAWGLHLCPSLRADLHELHQILGSTSLRSEDWLVSSTCEKLAVPLGAFFQRCTGRSYLNEATSQRVLLRDAALAGVRFGGYVELDASLVLNEAGRAAKELWVLAKDGGRPKLILNPDADAGRIEARDALPLSPVFFIPSIRGHLLQKPDDSLSHVPAGVQPALIQTAFLTPP